MCMSLKVLKVDQPDLRLCNMFPYLSTTSEEDFQSLALCKLTRLCQGLKA